MELKIKKLVYANVDVVGITLPTKEVYEAAKDIVPKLDGWWWLRSPGSLSNSAAAVSGGGVYDRGIIVDNKAVSVRPALRLKPESCHLSIGDRILAAGKTWTVIPGDLALCDDSIGRHCFREDWKAPDANDYGASDVKKYIEGWARENGLLPKEVSSQDIAGITLPTKEEYEAAKDIVPKLDGWWWLRLPGSVSCYAAYVGHDGGVHDLGLIVDDMAVSVRPALQLNPESCHLSIGDRILAVGKTWTVIPGDLALCDDSIGRHCFREDWKAPDANDYGASDVKKYIEGWARENGLLPKEVSSQDIAGITIPSKEEYLEAKDIVPELDRWWWLRLPGSHSLDAAYVVAGGGVLDNGYGVDDEAVSVRPALRLNPKSCNLSIGNKVQAAGYTWTVIPGDMALCDEFIGEHCFREDWRAPDANVYEASDVKQFVEDWAREHGLPV